jgi:hypothetical protein
MEDDHHGLISIVLGGSVSVHLIGGRAYDEERVNIAREVGYMIRH